VHYNGPARHQNMHTATAQVLLPGIGQRCADCTPLVHIILQFHVQRIVLVCNRSIETLPCSVLYVLLYFYLLIYYLARNIWSKCSDRIW